MQATERSMTSWDGVELFYRAWLPAIKTDKALLLFHRGHEHSGRWQEMVDGLNLKDIAVFAWDARGHGRSSGERGAARNGADIIKDVDLFAHHVSQRYEVPLENTIVLAHSLGAVHVAAWVHDYAPAIRAMILATAAFRVRLYVPFAIPALRLKQKFSSGGYVQSYVKARMLTHDAQQAARYDADPLIFRQIAVNVLLYLHDTGKRLVADAGAIQTPTLILGAGRDWVVSLKAQQEFFARLSSPIKEMEIYPSDYHALFHEQNRHRILDRVRKFVRERFAQPPVTPSLLQADRAGYTWNEYERLCRNGKAKFAVARAGLRVAGRLSRGVDLGWRSGFDSGLSLDYVYKNEPRGSIGLGRWIDKSYLNSIGWRGIRQRKTNLEAALQNVIGKVHDEGRPVRILDIAAGAGRYVIETMHRTRAIPMSARLRDYKQENVDAAHALAGEFKIDNVRAEPGDAFDRDALAAITPRATIGIVSGLYELFSSNELVLKSLRGLFAAIEPGGYLIYTNQPWHPQVAFIAGVLRNREGKPWIMRRRTTAEMDELVRVAGFEKTAMEVDQWGMFTVSVARKRLTNAAVPPLPYQGRGEGEGSGATRS
jgi:alpha-beta hydrolase superfamily lysophospholipase/SAM-dependent methyltransferase